MSDFTVGYQDGWFTLTSDTDGVTQTAWFSPGTKTQAEAEARSQLLRDAYPVTRQWAQDAAATNTNWPTMTQQQKDTALRETIRRLGLFFDNFAELLASLNADV